MKSQPVDIQGHHADPQTHHADVQAAAERGVALCRGGKWKEGLKILGGIAEVDRQGAELAGLFYSYLGYGIARYERRLKEGMALCKYAVKIQFYEPENYLNLSRVYLLRHDRKRAVQALERALKLNPSHPLVVRQVREIGYRRRPVIPFLSRRNPVNKALGRMRHQRLEEKQEEI